MTTALSEHAPVNSEEARTAAGTWRRSMGRKPRRANRRQDLEVMRDRGLSHPGRYLRGNAPMTVADLRGAPDREMVRRMRMEGYFLEMPVLDAFDAVAWVLRSSVSLAIRQ